MWDLRNRLDVNPVRQKESLDNLKQCSCPQEHCIVGCTNPDCYLVMSDVLEL